MVQFFNKWYQKMSTSTVVRLLRCECVRSQEMLSGRKWNKYTLHTHRWTSEMTQIEYYHSEITNYFLVFRSFVEPTNLYEHERRERRCVGRTVCKRLPYRKLEQKSRTSAKHNSGALIARNTSVCMTCKTLFCQENFVLLMAQRL